jgi:hypothetical protein
MFSVLSLQAQSSVQMEEHDLSPIINPWLQVTNAAGLGLSTVNVHGVTELGYFSESGDYHRSQQGDNRSGLNFYSERYDKIGKNWKSWGSFNFVMDREQNRAWSDVFSTYNSNPYIFGSSVPGNYDRQLFDFRVKLSSVEKGRFTYGVGIDYLVGDLSRLRDPRTRVFLADYSFLPAITYRLSSKQHIGFNLKASYRKEKMPSITTVQDDPNLKYYTFFGIENADAVIGGFKGFQRQFVSDIYGGELQYALKMSQLELLIAGGVNYEQQEILESLRQSPGSYEAINYNVRLAGKAVSNGILYNFKLNGNLKSGAADEFVQKLISTNNQSTGVNSQNWVTLFTYNNRFVNSVYDASLNFDIRNINASRNDYSWLVGFKTGVSGFTNQYNLPYSEFSANRLNASLYGHYRLINKNSNRLTLNANIGYSTGFHNALQLSNGAIAVPELGASTFKQGVYDVATNILLPDLQFYKQNVLDFRADARYSFPLKVKKSVLTGQVKAYFGMQRSENLGSWTSAGVSVGIITL